MALNSSRIALAALLRSRNVTPKGNFARIATTNHIYHRSKTNTAKQSENKAETSAKKENEKNKEQEVDMDEVLEEVTKSAFKLKQDLGKRAQGVYEATKTAYKSSEKIGKGAQDMYKKTEGSRLRNNPVSNFLSDAVEEIAHDWKEEADKSKPYQSPVDRRREALEKKARRQAFVKPDDTATGVTLHKGSMFDNIGDLLQNNAVTSRLADIRIRFEESDNILARITRGFVERVSEGLQGTFSDGEQAQVLEEIVRMDPTFDIHEFGTHCQRVIIPAVLEAYMAGDSSVMKDWCTESRYTVFKEDIEAREARGEKWTFRILDLDDVNLVAAKLLDDQPLLLYSFTVQQILTVRNATGEIVDGGEDEVKRALYLIYMRRDPTEFDPMLAWEVADLQQHMMQ
eukprot:m.270035 g.270035  ORF g.270035 m.270035 type:complete len:399 (+) comp16261_c1_seq2:120-1316(+)